MLKPDKRIALATDACVEGDLVLVGIATHERSIVMTIDKAEYAADRFAMAMGFERGKPLKFGPFVPATMEIPPQGNLTNKTGQT